MWHRSYTKYGNHKVQWGDETFDSKKELTVWLELQDRLKKGEISDLRRQVSFEIIPAIYATETVHLKTKDKVVRKCVQKAVHYIADFVFVEDGKEVVMDAKGGKATITREFVLKKKLMRYFHGIDVRVI